MGIDQTHVIECSSPRENPSLITNSDNMNVDSNPFEILDLLASPKSTDISLVLRSLAPQTSTEISELAIHQHL